jgi:hypothetical protein
MHKATPNQPEANLILIEANCQNYGAGQLQCIEKVEESMGGRVCGEQALVHYPEEESFQTGLKWTTALADSGRKISGDIQELAAVG